MGEVRRYRAFISYSHVDAAFGRRLHRRLEAYRLPHRLVGRPGVSGPVPARLAPIFRDREELPAANDLSEQVRAALGASESLIVVCSPAAAASPWVAREVELFRDLHPDRPVLAALVEGEPSAAFCPPLRISGAGAVEPLAADFRPHRDGERLALLKLVAGILGIGLDELVQRDAQRRVQGVTAVTGAALAAMLAMGLLTTFAVSARIEAEHQRAGAEGLVEFMLTDLRRGLKGVGRLDVMNSVDQRALAYYRGQDLRRLPARSLERRARTLHALGEDAIEAGRDAQASAAFAEARRTTSTLLAASPHDPERIYDQAQSEYWTGYVPYRQGRARKALPYMGAYKRLADQLVVLDPRNPTYLREVGYAEGALCALNQSTPPNRTEALRACRAALNLVEGTARISGGTREVKEDLINRHAWLANALEINGDLKGAMMERHLQAELLVPLMSHDVRNMELRDTWVALQRSLADLDIRLGKYNSARLRLKTLMPVVDTMIHDDPHNVVWSKQREYVKRSLSSINSRIKE